MRKAICIKKNNWGFIKNQTYYFEKFQSYISVKKNINDIGRLFTPDFFNEVFKDLQEERKNKLEKINSINYI